MGLRIGGWSLAAAAMSVNAACMNFRPDPPLLPADVTASAPPERWAVDGGRGATAPIVAHGGRVYLGGADRQVRAIAIDSGQELWHRRLGGTVLGGVVLRDSMLYLATSRPDGRILALHAETGETIWQAGSGDVSVPLAVGDDVIAGINRKGELVAVDPATGKVRWRRRIGLSRLAPLALPGEFLVAKGDSVIRIEAGGGRVRSRAALTATPIDWQSAGHLLIVTGADSSLMGLRPADLSVAWRASLDGPVLGRVAVHADTAWVVTRPGTLYEVLHREGRAEPRRLATLRAPITTGVTRLDGILLVGGADGVLRGLRRDGGTEWQVTLSWNITVDPVAVPGGFIAAGGDGDLHLFAQ